jgi:hypothetical protein
MHIRKFLLSAILLGIFAIVIFLLYNNAQKKDQEKNALSTVYSSLSSGNWSTDGTWSPVGVPGGSDNITINHTITSASSFVLFGTLNINAAAILTIKSLEVKSGACLNLYGTLNVEDLVFDNGSHVHFYSGSSANISNDFHNKNNSNDVVFDGTMNVLGEFINGNGGLITGSGFITAHQYSGDGTTYGYNPTDDVADGSTIPSSLPVQLLSFDVKQKENAVEINWSTASETNNNYFSVERSTDANNFTEIKQVKGAGNSNSTIKYTINDASPVSGTSYYRLKQTDFDGKTETFQPEALKFNSGSGNSWGNVVAAPNPFITDFNLEYFSADENTVEVSIYGINGQLVYKEKMQPVSGNNTWHYNDNSSMKTGIYFVTLFADGRETKTLKVMKD